MKVLEEYLTMSVEEQTDEIYAKLYPSGMRNSLAYNQLKKEIEYLNSEVEQDPLEKLGWTRQPQGMYAKEVANFIQINKTGRAFYVDCLGIERPLRLSAETNKAILEIMEGIK